MAQPAPTHLFPTVCKVMPGESPRGNIQGRDTVTQPGRQPALALGHVLPGAPRSGAPAKGSTA